MEDYASALTEPEQQVLIAIVTLESRGEPASSEAVERCGQNYFGIFRLDWSGALDRLEARSLLTRDGDRYSLSTAGAGLAETLRQHRPKHVFFYDEYYDRVEHSRAHASFCERVYDRNLAQHGMMDMAQLRTLIEVLGLTDRSVVLELGCGNGMVAEHISDVSGAHVTGVDTSAVGVRHAIERTSGKRARLTFLHGDMATIDLPLTTFDTIVAIDTVYFVDELASLLGRLRRLLVPGGQMGIFYSAFVAAGEPREPLHVDQTKLAVALRATGLAYEALDLTDAEVEHWRKKLRVSRELRSEFEAEGNEFLYERRSAEAEFHQRYVEAGNVSRYLYHVKA